MLGWTKRIDSRDEPKLGDTRVSWTFYLFPNIVDSALPTERDVLYWVWGFVRVLQKYDGVFWITKGVLPNAPHDVGTGPL